MPFLIRLILQRILLFVYSVLAFLGIAPEVHVPAQTGSPVAERQEETVTTLINETGSAEQTENVQTVIQGAEETITDIVENTIPDIVDQIPTDLLPTQAPPIPPVQSPIIKPTSQPVAPEPETPISTQTQPQPTKPTETEEPEPTTNVTIKDLVVNIVCVQTVGNTINVSTGSGVLVSPKGIVLTNAHVAQFFILEAYNPNLITCSMYKENIPTYGYRGKLLYISPNWVKDNYKTIKTANARGTGEDDYALIAITENTNPIFGLPQSFPSAELRFNDVEIGDDVIVAGYPGGPTSLVEITRAGKLKFADVSILEVFTFGGNNIDIFTTSKSEVGAKGASGGGVFYGSNINSNALVGTIVTTDGTNGNAKINAITTQYIEEDIENDSGFSLSYYLSGNTAAKIKDFEEQHVEPLAELLLKEI